MKKLLRTQPCRPRVTAVAGATAVLLLVLGSVSACGSSAAHQATADTNNPLYATAKKEGSLTWYTSEDPTAADKVAKAFGDAYPGITVKVQRLTTGEITARYSKERDAGSSPADVLTIGDPDFLQEGVKKDWFESDPKLPNLKHFPSKYVNNGVALVSMIPLGITYNTNLVKHPPKTWKDALGPAYKGKIQLGDPRNVPAYMQLDYLLNKEFGSGFLKSMAANNPTIYPSLVNATQTVASGGAALAVPGTYQLTHDLQAKGAPINFAAISPTVGVEFYTASVKGAPHANAGHLFYDYLLSKEGQTVLNQSTSSPLGKLSGTQPLPGDYQQVSNATTAPGKPKILSALGLQ